VAFDFFLWSFGVFLNKDKGGSKDTTKVVVGKVHAKNLLQKSSGEVAPPPVILSPRVFSYRVLG
jgi:hypothetical protein